MDRKVSLYILLPEHNKRINYLVPQSMLIRTMIKLVCKTLLKTGIPIQEGVQYNVISTANGMLLPMDKSVYDTGLYDGCELLMMGGSHGSNTNKYDEH